MTAPPKSVITISKEELAKLPMAECSAELRLIDSPDNVEQAVADLRKSDVIGFDTETKPSFKRGQLNSVSLLQLSTRDVCYLFRLNMIGLPQCLVELLEDESKLKIGVSIHDDFHNLARLQPISPKGFIDLQTYVKEFIIADNSLSKIYAIVFGKRISKSQRLTNWEAPALSMSQQAYAALDALACIELYDYLSSGKFLPTNSQYLRAIEENPIVVEQGIKPKKEDAKSKAVKSRRRKTASRKSNSHQPVSANPSSTRGDSHSSGIPSVIKEKNYRRRSVSKKNADPSTIPTNDKQSDKTNNNNIQS